MAIQNSPAEPGTDAVAASQPPKPTWMRWLAVPVALLIALLLLLATGAMSRDEAEQSEAVRDAAEQVAQSRAGDGTGSGTENGARGGTGIAQIDRSTVVFETENGTYAVSSDGTTLAGPGEDGDVYVQSLRPDPDGEPLGFRVNPDGTFDVVNLNDLGPDDIAIVPNGNGFTILGESDDLTVTVTNRGTFVYDSAGNLISELPNQKSEPSDLTFSQLPDGVFDLVPDVDFDRNDSSDDADTSETASSPPTSNDGAGLNLWIIVGVLAAALAAVGVGLWLWRRQDDDTEPTSLATAAPATRQIIGPSEWDQFQRFVAELRSDPDPRRAIERAYHYVEGGTGPLRGRALTETPVEYQTAMHQIDGQLAGHLRTITDAIVRLEYGFGTPTSSERDLVIDDLEALVRKASSMGSTPAARPANSGGPID